MHAQLKKIAAASCCQEGARAAAAGCLPCVFYPVIAAIFTV